MNKFAERLKELRIEKGLSQDQLAKKVGLTHTAIGLWEQNKREPKIQSVIDLAKFFGVTVGYLVGAEN